MGRSEKNHILARGGALVGKPLPYKCEDPSLESSQKPGMVHPCKPSDDVTEVGQVNSSFFFKLFIFILCAFV